MDFPRVGRRMYGLSPTSVVTFEKSGDDGVASSMSSVWVSGTCCLIDASCAFVTFCIAACRFRSTLVDDSCSSICFPKSISHVTAYHSLCDTLTSGSGRYSFDRTVTSGIRWSGT